MADGGDHHLLGAKMAFLWPKYAILSCLSIKEYNYNIKTILELMYRVK